MSRIRDGIREQTCPTAESTDQSQPDSDGIERKMDYLHWHAEQQEPSNHAHALTVAHLWIPERVVMQHFL